MNLRFRKFKWAGFKQTIPRLSLWIVTVTYMCLYIGLSHPTIASAQTVGSQTIQQSSTVSTATTTINSPKGIAKPNEMECIFWFIFWILVVVGIILGALWLLCQAAHLCGNTGSPPPQIPPGNPDQVVFSKGVRANGLISPSIPTTIFYYTGGILQSNSAGLPQATVPPFISVDGQPLPFGGQIGSGAPAGVTTPPSIGIWTETNTFFDTNLDAVYPYAIVYNFSVLTTTNIINGTQTNWNELCTIIGWLNENPTVPLACYITYTNGVALATNWAQCYLNSYLQPTNIVVYGTLANLSVPNPIGVTGAILSTNGGGLGGGIPDPTDTNDDNGTNGSPFVSFPQFFKLTCSTNQIKTSWTP